MTARRKKAGVFIVEKKAINVTATDEIPERETKGLKEFQQKNKQFSLTLVTASVTDGEMVSLEEFLRGREIIL